MLKRRLNPFLLASTVLILSLLAGLSVLYQGQLDNVMTDKQDLTEEIAEMEEELVVLENEKSNLTRQLADVEDDRDRYIDLYESEEEQRQELQEDIGDLDDEIERLEGASSEVQDLNESLADICSLEYENFEDSYARSICENEGHR